MFTLNFTIPICFIKVALNFIQLSLLILWRKFMGVHKLHKC